MSDHEFFKAIRRIQIQTTHLADDVLAGAYHSAFKGKGMEFEEVREYLPGDEVRSIDWNVTARTGFPYIKKFNEERELTVMLVVDTSSSLRFGSGNQLKSELIAEIGGVLAFSAIKNHDKVGLVTFSDHVELFLPPKKGVRHVLRVIRELLTTPLFNKKTDVGQAITFFGKVQKRKAICFIISDFICPDFSHELTLLVKKHDVIAIAVTDPCELNFPNVNLATLSDLESGKNKVIDTSYPFSRPLLPGAAEKRLSGIKEIMKKNGGGFIDIRTNRPYLEEIKKFFRQRSRRL